VDCITEIQRQETWFESRAVQNAIFASATFSVIVTNAKGIVQSFNVGAERMLGYSSADVVNKVDLLYFHDPQEVLARARALSLDFATPVAAGFETLTFKPSRGIEDSCESTYLGKDGSRVPVCVEISALRDDSGIVIGYVAIGTDVSAHKQANADFLSRMSHELRTPLNAILGFAQLLKSGSPSVTSPQERNIDLILEAGWQQLELINGMLDLAANPAGGPVRRILYIRDSATNSPLVEIARASQPDVILMDINLPAISGVSALSIFADDPATAHIPVVTIVKPINVNEFRDTLDVAFKCAKTPPATTIINEQPT
jgi:PAS domain S-box-containing protein